MIPTTPPVGYEVEGGANPPGSPSPLYGRCDNCGKPRGVKSLIAVCVQERQSSEPRWVMICGPCFVEGVMDG